MEETVNAHSEHMAIVKANARMNLKFIETELDAIESPGLVELVSGKLSVIVDLIMDEDPA